MARRTERLRAKGGDTVGGTAAHPSSLQDSLSPICVGGSFVAQLDNSVMLPRLHPASSLPGEQQ
jgi:hypothetical protein